ncbi:MAG TPA: hypothetical protein VGO52_04250 [Hyphomonadaceae bacterium]|jgi:hypothetical protein|nr:hypothetical protein [Hyphomonadaceae bacterium]
MGIYLQAFALRTPLLGGDPQEAMGQSAARWAKQRGLSSIFYLYYGDNGDDVLLSFYPPNGCVRFSISEERVDFGIKTSTAGPGYHLALIDLCDHFERELGLQWRWDAGGDSCGYALSRSHDELYKAFLGQLRGLCEFMQQHDHGLPITMNIDVQLGGDEVGMVSLPLGPMPGSRLIDAAHADDKTLAELAKRFYPWWSREADADFWLSLLRVMLWTEAPWRRPDTEWESFLCNAIEAAKAEARKAFPALPGDLEKTLAELRGPTLDDEPPPQGEIGYRRRKRRFALTGRWQLEMPGYYHEDVDADGSNVMIWHPAHETIQASSVSMNRKDTKDWPGALAGQPEHKANTHVFRINPEIRLLEDRGVRVAMAECVTDAGGETQMLFLSVAGLMDEAALRDRIREVARSALYDSDSQTLEKPAAH